MDFARNISIGDLERDPYPIFARLRRESPVVEVPAANAWFITRWEDVEWVTKSAREFSAETPSSPIDHSFGRPTILTCDGEVHRNLRGGIEAHYKARQVATYIEDLARPICEERRDMLARGSSINLMSDYFEPVSALALARTLGLGAISDETLVRWFHGLSQGAINYERNPKRQQISDATCAEIDAELIPQLEALATEPDQTPLSHMLHFNRTAGNPRPVSEILPTVKVTLLGGMQEPGHGAGSVFVGLMQNRDQFEAVKAGGRSILADAVNEGLRWVAPIGTQLRTATRDVEIAGTIIPEGTPVLAVISSANRDETRFEDPDTFNIFRANLKHAAFGFGHHFCAGRWFSVALMEIMLDVLFEAFPEIALDNDPHFLGWEFRMAPEIMVTLDR